MTTFLPWFLTRGAILGTVIVQSVVLSWCEYIGGFHSAAFFRAQQASDHKASLEAENLAVIADPITFRQLLDAVAGLMDWDVAVAAEDYHVFVFVVAVVTDSTLSIILSLDSSHVRASAVSFLLVL